MKCVLETLIKKSIICKKLEILNKKEFKIRKKIEIYYGVTTKSYYIIIFKIDRKSKVFQKDIKMFEELLESIKVKLNRNFKIKALIIDAPLCSKAKNLLRELKWKLLG